MKRTLFLLYTLCLFCITPAFSQDSQGSSFMHINSETGLSQSNVKVRLSRARALLKESLKGEWNYDE